MRIGEEGRLTAEIEAEFPNATLTRDDAAMVDVHRTALQARVMRSDGILAGYRWGLAVKRSLLVNESA